MNEAKKNRLNTTQKILIVGFLCLIVVIGVAAFFLIKAQNKKDDAEPKQAGSLVIDESNLADVEEQLEQTVADGMFEINMNTIWHFPDGESASSDAYVANGIANHHPISFDILLDGTEKIYSSSVIPLGKQIKEIILEKDLEAGSYQAQCLYHLWNEDGTESSTFGVNIIIDVAK